MSNRVALCVASVVLLLVSLAPARADESVEAPKAEGPAAEAAEGSQAAAWSDQLTWRSIGPANMGGRITSVAVFEQDPTTWWAATASGGLVKTVNDGVTFEHQFDHEATVSIGSVAVAQSDANVVWVGTGEANPRNSVSSGNGVYKSTDGGATWTHMGLAGTFQISSVRVHPENADIVYVGAMGRCWGTNEERGLFKTLDGGATWTKILYVDEKTGVIDVQLRPGTPDTLLVATWERQRDGFDTNDPAKKWGPGSALWRTTDGGTTFEKISAGLPTVQVGRIGIDFSRANPDTVFMVLETEKIGTTPPDSPYLGVNGEDAEVGCRLTSVIAKGPSAKAGLKKGDIVLAVDGDRVHSYVEFVKRIRRQVAGDTIKLEVVREKQTQHVELTLGERPEAQRKAESKQSSRDGGVRRGPSPFSARLGGQRPNMQDQQGTDGHEYGGVYRSADGGVTWSRVNSLDPRPMYFSEVRVDPQDEQRVYVLGVRLWRSMDGGATFSPDGHDRRVHVDHHAMWIDPADPRHIVLGNDGGIYVTRDRMANWDHLNHVAIGQFYHVGVGPHRDYRVYGGMQDNGSWGGPSRVRHGGGPTNSDWFRVGGGDGFRCLVDANDADLVYFESQNGGVGRRHLASGERAGMRPHQPRGTKTPYRFNWQTPFLLSHHNSRIFYMAGNHVFRSLDRGNEMQRISPEITHTKRGSATALAESPRDSNLLYVGSDDGALWVSRDGGHTWTDLYAKAEPEAPKADPEAPKGPATEDERVGGDGGEGDDTPGGKGDEQPDTTDDAEQPAAPSSRTERMLERLLALDADADGKLQRAEAPDRMQRLFDRVDGNKDGVLEADEIRAAFDRPVESGGAKPAVDDGSRPIKELVPDRRWVSWIEPSRFEAGRAYLVFDAHRSDDDKPYVFVTENAGRTWRSLVSDLPKTAGSTHVLREDLVNANVLYLGTELGAWISIDRGASWTKFGDLPTVAVHSFALHPSAGEIVAATHGRSLWVMDVNAVRQMSKTVLGAAVHLFKPGVAVQWKPAPGVGASRSFVGQNPDSGARITYRLAQKADGVSLKITSLDGKLLRELKTSGKPGLHMVSWNLRSARREGRQGRVRDGPRVKPGTYRVVLESAGKTFTQNLVVAIDPAFPDERWIGFANAQEAEEADRAQADSDENAPLHRED